MIAPVGRAADAGLIATSSRAAAVPSSAIRDLLAVTAAPGVISLAGGLPDRGAIPADWLGECLAWAAGQDGALQYSTTEGHPGLREVIAGWESDWQGRAVDPAEVLVTAGAQQALDLLGVTLLDPGDLVVVEDPAYVGALQAFQLAGARIMAIPQDGDGMITAQLEQLLVGGHRPRVVYTTATFHNPAGTTLSEARRAHLAALADRFGFVVVEDDAYRRLYFDALPPRPVGGRSGRVIRLGTFSKILSPGLRVGWVTADAATVAALVRTKQATDLHTSTLAQVALHRAAEDSTRLDRHVHAIRQCYRGRATHLHAEMASMFGDVLEMGRPGGGMFTWIRFRDGTDTDALLPRAVRAGMAFVPGSAFGTAARNRNCVRMCFATVPEAELTEAVARLAAAVSASPGEALR